jgi:glycine C-acetyltransferase/8-amino-7-oxononanoate synthase
VNAESPIVEDDQLIERILTAAARVERCIGGRAFASVLNTPEDLDLFAHCAATVGDAAQNVSDTLRNWATHVPWEELAALRESEAAAVHEPTALQKAYDFLNLRMPAVRQTLAEMYEPAHLRLRVDPEEEYALDKNAHDFYRPAGRDLLTRTEEYFGWVQARRKTETWQYSRRLDAAPGSFAVICNDTGRSTRGINFNSQDYLSLNAHPAVLQAAMRALHDFGPHSAGSPMVLGNTRISDALEQSLSELLQMEHITLFPTGWAAGFGSLVGLLRQEDHVVIDRLAHACLQQGARAATRNIIRYEHLNVAAVREHLQQIRQRDPRNGILVVTDGLFSVDADWPDLVALQAACREYEATLLVDVAHDLGAMGPGGTGVLGMQSLLGQVDLVMGSFSKTFASNGGFLASRRPAVKQYVKMFAGSHLFSNALSAVQTAVVHKALEIVRAEEGKRLRQDLAQAVHALRDELTSLGLTCMGEPSPIVPLLIGNEKLARIANRRLFDRGVLAFMVEFPVTPVGQARFRLQVQAMHDPAEARAAARVIAESIAEARSYLASGFGSGL